MEKLAIVVEPSKTLKPAGFVRIAINDGDAKQDEQEAAESEILTG
jgi:hypothetical protein